MQLTYPNLVITGGGTPAVSMYNLTVTSGTGYEYNTKFNVSYIDPKDTGILNITTAWKLPTKFNSNYPDSLRINLDGYKTGPGLEFNA